jgi:hypothetical protein
MNSIVVISGNTEIALHLSANFQVSLLNSIEDLPDSEDVRVVIFDELSKVSDVSWIRRAYPTAFISVFSPSSVENPHYRLNAFNAGANQVVYDIETLMTTITEDVVLGPLTGNYHCPYCGIRNMSEDELWIHCPAYHINWPNDVHVTNTCPICQLNLNSEPLQVIFIKLY